ncbi:MAG: UDP-N-acetylmuramoyl-tripeptide--D-alanyl-D-alanine ligase, partial [Sulfuricella sp.]|nr:UDP-N-acetylmuramoyl-tripeptide--D-alanyl-D-alanine ligase [Sulfuricella sp.]
PLLVVDDTRLALGRLARQWRLKINPAVLAITGSNGKTTVKEMSAAILRAAAGPDAVLATAGNYNNDIGLPLTLLKLRAPHRYAVIEMGMNHPREIAYLTKLARADVALINNAHPAHLAGLGTVEAVARAKGEIFEGLAEHGSAIVNADDPHAELWRELAHQHKVVTFGLNSPAEVSADYRLDPDGSWLKLSTPRGEIELVLHAPGLHNVRNALAATAAALALDVPLGRIAHGLESFTPVKGRLHAKPAVHGAQLIDDSYNANPGSVRAAIDTLAAWPGKRVLVLGDMGELGTSGPRLHGEIGAYAKQAGIDRLLALGELSIAAARSFGSGGQHFETIEDLLHEAENQLAPDVVMLVKGSRFMKMERVVISLEMGNEQ